MRIGLVTAAICLCLVGLAAADDVKAAIRKDTSVPAGGLGPALQALAKQHDFQVLYRTEVVGSLRTEGAVGQFTSEEALKQVLKGTGLTYRYLDEKTITILPASNPAGMQGPPTTANLAGAATPEKEEARNSGAFLLAQVDQTNAGPQVARDKEEPRNKGELQEIVVTGTHIRGADPASSVISIDSTDIERAGYQSAGDVVRNLPQSFGGGVNPNVVGGDTSSNPYNPSGASSANLRGLGSGSTLTLVNGERLTAADVTGATDISLIPLSAVERVEILTDGASAIYGSDAVGGVVNFILKKHYDGVEASATYGSSSDGGGTLQRYDALGGTGWATGNVIASYEYSKQREILASQRSFTAQAGSQTTLLPEAHRNSLFATAAQSLGSTVSLFAEGLYTWRASDASMNQPGAEVINDRARVQQYGIAGGAKFELPSGWQASLSDNLARTSTDDPQTTVAGGLLLQTNEQHFENGLNQIELTANGPLFHLQSGPLQLAVGASHRRETLSSPLTIIAAGAAPAFSNVAGDRNVDSIYAEVNVPLVGRPDNGDGASVLALTAAGRHEHYSDFGSGSVPKLGLIYKPIHDLEFKASWGRSFRAPTLVEEHDPEQVYLFQFPDPAASATGFAPSLYRLGGNPGLQPERSTSTAFSTIYGPSWLPGGSIEIAYFNIKYRDRIENPVTSASPLTDPSAAPFVVLNPTAAQQAAIIAGASMFQNFSGAPYNPATVAAVIDNRYANVEIQTAEGVDVLANYRIATNIGDFDVSVNATYLNLEQRVTSVSSPQQLSGTVFNPPKPRGRAGLTWENKGLSASTFVSYTGRSSDPSASPAQSIGSWTTLDAHLGYRFEREGNLKGVGVSLSAQNLFDQRPPYLASGQLTVPNLHFDPTNSSVVGRFVALQAVKEW